MNQIVKMMGSHTERDVAKLETVIADGTEEATTRERRPTHLCRTTSYNFISNYKF